MRRTVVLSVVLLVATGAVAFGLSPAQAQTRSVAISARIDNQRLSSATKSVRLSTRRPVTLELTLRNPGTTPFSVRAIRIEGRVAGLTFFGYSTITRFTVAGGATDRRRIDIDLLDLGDQATGLIPAKLRVLDTNRKTIASRRFVADVRGSATSTYATFTLVLALATAAVFAATLLGLARNKLSPNRFVRAGLFLVSGIGIGFVLVFAVSVLRILAPVSPRWQPLVLIPAAVFFVLGYLTPTPTQEGDWEADQGYGGYDGYDEYQGAEGYRREGEFTG